MFYMLSQSKRDYLVFVLYSISGGSVSYLLDLTSSSRSRPAPLLFKLGCQAS